MGCDLKHAQIVVHYYSGVKKISLENYHFIIMRKIFVE